MSQELSMGLPHTQVRDSSTRAIPCFSKGGHWQEVGFGSGEDLNPDTPVKHPGHPLAGPNTCPMSGFCQSLCL